MEAVATDTNATPGNIGTVAAVPTDASSSSLAPSSDPAIEYETLTSAGDWHFSTLLGGVLWLVRDGRDYIEQSLADGEDMTVERSDCPGNHCWSSQRDPGVARGPGTSSYERDQFFIRLTSARTAIGHTLDGALIIVSIDGKTNIDRPEVNRDLPGINLHDMASLLISFGALNAINLDGGGSATVVVDGLVSNYPSDTSAVDDPTDSTAWNRRDKIQSFERLVSTITCIHDDDGEDESVDDRIVEPWEKPADDDQQQADNSDPNAHTIDSASGSAATTPVVDLTPPTVIQVFDVSFNSSEKNATQALIDAAAEAAAAAEAQAIADAEAALNEREAAKQQAADEAAAAIEMAAAEAADRAATNLHRLIAACVVIGVIALAVSSFFLFRWCKGYRFRAGFDLVGSTDSDIDPHLTKTQRRQRRAQPEDGDGRTEFDDSEEPNHRTIRVAGSTEEDIDEFLGNSEPIENAMEDESINIAAAAPADTPKTKSIPILPPIPSPMRIQPADASHFELGELELSDGEDEIKE